MKHFATYSRSNDCFPANCPSVFTSAKDCHVTAQDGREFIDWGMSLRSVILGYCNENVDNAVIKAIQKGISFTRSNPYEEELRELIRSIIPCAEEVKFGKNGSDATSAAIKLARAFTGRDIVLIAEENPFYSQHDWFIGTTSFNDGIPYCRECNGTITKYSYNDLLIKTSDIWGREDTKVTRLEWLCEAFRPAAIILDASTVDITKEKLQYIRDLCTKHGVIMILDEVISGFRYGISGVQGLYGVTPDLATFGKAMANGYSISALCGKRDLMQLGDREHGNTFLMSGTYFSNTPDLAAGIATIHEIRQKGVIDHINNIGSNLCEGLQQAIDLHNMGEHVKFSPASRHCNPQLTFSSMELKTLWDQCMIERGILIPYISPSYSHTINEVEQTLEAADYALSVCRKAINERNVKELLLNGHCERSVFRKKG